MEQAQQGPQIVPGAGWAGVASAIAQAIMQGRTRKKEGARLEGLAGQISQGQMAQSRAQQEAELAAELAKEERAHNYKMQEQAAKPHAMIPQMTNQGLVMVDPYSGGYTPAQPMGQGPTRMAGADGMPVSIGADVPPEIRDQIMAAERAGRPPTGPLMPYEKPKAPSRPTVSEVGKRKQELAELAAAGVQMSPQEQRAYLMTGKAPSSVSEGRPSDDEKKVSFATAAMREDAINFAAAYLGKPPTEVAKMTPEQIRDAMKQHGRFSSGPVIGSLPGMRGTINSDLEAYTNSAAGKKARMNNPTGPVSNADFEIARRSIFSADKPDAVNADLIYQALSVKPTTAGPRVAVPQVSDDPLGIL